MEAVTRPAQDLVLHVNSGLAIAAEVFAVLAILVIGFGFYLPARWKYRHIPGPRPKWYKGNLDQLGVPHSFHETLTNWSNQYGKIYKLFLGARPVVVITDPELVKQVCIKQFKNFHDRPRNAIQYSHGEQEEFWEGGIIVLRGKYWAGIRAACEPLFHSRMLRKYASVMNGAASKLVSKVDSLQSDMQINKHLAAMTMDVIGKTAFGVDFDAQESEKKSEIVAQCQVVFEPAGDKAGNTNTAARKPSPRRKKRFSVNLHKLMLLFPSLMGLLYRLSCLLGVPKVLRLTTARGYIVGTSQVLLQNARDSKQGKDDILDSNSSGCETPRAQISKAPGLATPPSSTTTDGPMSPRSSSGSSSGHSTPAPGSPNHSGVLSPANSGNSSGDHSTAGSATLPDPTTLTGIRHRHTNGDASDREQALRHTDSSTGGDSMLQARQVEAQRMLSERMASTELAAAEPLKPASYKAGLDAWAFAKVDRLYQKAKARGVHMYRNQVPEDFSLFHHLMNAVNKETGEPLSNISICAQAFTMLLAGYETTSTALSYTLYALARNPEVYRKLLAEVDAFGRDKEPTFDDLAQFKWTEACFLEAMRMYPIITPLWALAREAGNDVQLGGYHIPKGTRVWLNVRGLHYDEANFPNPKAYRPERFLDDSPVGPSSRHQYAYMAFGAGPHKCLGYRFAMEEGILTLVRLHQRFSFTLNQDKHPAGSELSFLSAITYMPKGGIWLDAHPRETLEQQQ